MLATECQWDQIVERLRPRLLAFGRSRLSVEVAEDCVQDTFLDLWSMRDRIWECADYWRLAAKIMSWRIIDQIRAEGRRHNTSLTGLEEEPAVAAPTPHEVLEKNEQHELALLELREHQAAWERRGDRQASEIVRITCVECRSTEEAVRETGARPARVYNVKFAAVRKSRQDLAWYGG